MFIFSMQLLIVVDSPIHRTVLFPSGVQCWVRMPYTRVTVDSHWWELRRESARLTDPGLEGHPSVEVN